MSTPTVALFHEDDYAQAMDATLLAAGPDGVVLDQTVFYPRGGNQDCDTGALARRDDPAPPVPVVEVLKDDAGVITHRLDAPAAWPAGTAVHGQIRWSGRFTMMRLHTAQHLISRWFLDEQHNETTRVDINAARCVVEFALPITVDAALTCQAALNALIRAGRPVRRINTDGYLEIEVADYDRQPCGGTHVADIAEIAQIVLVYVRRNRLEFLIGEEARTQAGLMQQAVLDLAPEWDTSVPSFGEKARALWEELKAARAALFALREEVAAARLARALAAPPAATLDRDGLLGLYPLDLELLDSKQVPRLLKGAQGPGRVFLCLSAGRNLVVVSGAPAVPTGTLVRALAARWGLNGGGSPAVAQCGPLPAAVDLPAVLAATLAELAVNGL